MARLTAAAGLLAIVVLGLLSPDAAARTLKQTPCTSGSTSIMATSTPMTAAAATPMTTGGAAPMMAAGTAPMTAAVTTPPMMAAATPAAKPVTITSALAGAPPAQFSTLLAAVKAAGLADALNKPDLAYTIFAPTNDAFTKLITALKTTPEKLLADKALLTKVLSYHVVPIGVAKSTSLKNNQKLATLLKGQDLTVDLSKAGSVVIKGATNSATVIVPDVPAGKSVVHVINAVLVPK